MWTSKSVTLSTEIHFIYRYLLLLKTRVDMYISFPLCLSSPKHKKWTNKTRSKSAIEKKIMQFLRTSSLYLPPCHYLNKKHTAKYTPNKITFSVLKSLFSKSTSSTHTLYLSIYIHITRPTPHAFSPALSVTLSLPL